MKYESMEEFEEVGILGSMASSDSTQRFSSRVDNYVRCRPHYPPVLLDTLRQNCGLTGDSVLADIGSGTGILTRLFLEIGNEVYGVEPNKEMREAGENFLAAYPKFHSVAATAEETTLPDNSVDLIAAGQAFHWFDRERIKPEWRRILKPGGWVVLVWNDRPGEDQPLGRDYEALLQRFGTDYSQITHKQIGDEDFADFFEGQYSSARFDNSQVFDFEGLKGRLLSSSYSPSPDDECFEPMLAELKGLFDRYESGGKVVFEFETWMHYGRLDPQA